MAVGHLGVVKNLRPIDECEIGRDQEDERVSCRSLLMRLKSN